MHMCGLLASCIRALDPQLTRLILVRVRKGSRVVHGVHLWAQLLAYCWIALGIGDVLIASYFYKHFLGVEFVYV